MVFLVVLNTLYIILMIFSLINFYIHCFSFQRTIRISGVIGIVDGFIVKCKRPVNNEEAFFNYQHGTSLNVQIVSIVFKIL